MPPMITDDESEHSDAPTPAKETGRGRKKAVKVEEPEPHVEEDIEVDEEDDEESDDGSNPDEYVVEKILSHGFSELGLVTYEVKWKGYPKKEDRTWEPEENLATAQESLQAYFKKIGGRPVFADLKPEKPSKKTHKRKISEEPVASDRATPTGKRGRKKKTNNDAPPPTVAKGDELPQGSWESLIKSVTTIEELPDPKGGKMVRYAYLEWNSGRKSKHKLAVSNQKCPQKMLQYYEQHLTFRSPDEGSEAANGNSDLFP